MMLTTLWLLFLTLLSAGLEIILFLYLMGQKIRLRYFFLLLIFNLAFNFIYNHSSWFIIKFWGEDIYYLLLSFLLSTKTQKPLKIKIFNGLFPDILNNLSLRLITFFIFPFFNISITDYQSSLLISILFVYHFSLLNYSRRVLPYFKSRNQILRFNILL